MVDEFVYQFHDFCRFRSKDLKKRTPAEVEGLAANPRVWDTMEVRLRHDVVMVCAGYDFVKMVWDFVNIVL